uniref:NADH dehydrogenase subunit 5 n=1 Tax=Porphyridium aerugineum TaxID=2792 RepID=UPI001FCD2A2C|nr:NADH dehydrogenase subunit 5 [Porphyridium aerugineum]UNJ18820.1 NADH dehydrogenase subunit 5 [Porphyridium aerugineum]
MSLLIFWFSLISCIMNFSLGRFIGIKGTNFLSMYCRLNALLINRLITIEIIVFGLTFNFNLGVWINSELLLVNWEFTYNGLITLRTFIVIFVSICVHFYTQSYRCFDPHKVRFLGFLSLFTFFRLVLVASSNLLVLFLGWEGIGLASYLLIGFWFTRLVAIQSAIKALLLNRIGDLALYLSIAFFFSLFKTLDFTLAFSLVPFLLNSQFISFWNLIPSFEIISFFLFLSARGKSAQLTLHTWLPDAMEGPTPVSALIHAATLVTAGIFLMFRLSFIFEFTELTLTLVSIIGICTAFFAAITGSFQNDLKRVIAFSTCSQLGLIVIAYGLSNQSIALFHLLNHAFFKAVLFLCAGSIIHGFKDEQDLRRFGIAIKLLPVTYVIFLAASLCLIGFPGLTGFFSKDSLFEIICIGVKFKYIIIEAGFAFWFSCIIYGLTAFYSFRALVLLFFSNTSLTRNTFFNINESDFILLSALLPLFLCTLTIGFIWKELFISVGNSCLDKSLFTWYIHKTLIEAETLELTFKLLPLFVSILGLVGVILSFILNKWISNNFFVKQFVFIAAKKWFWDSLYSYFSYFFLYLAFDTLIQVLDRGLIEILAPSLWIYIFTFLNARIHYRHTSQLSVYLFWIFVFVMWFIFDMLELTNFNFHILQFNCLMFGLTLLI